MSVDIADKDDGIIIEPDISSLPKRIQEEIRTLKDQLQNDEITEKGFNIKRSKLVAPYVYRVPSRNCLPPEIQQKLDEYELEYNEELLTERGLRKKKLELLKDYSVADSKSKGHCFILNNYKFPSSGSITGYRDGQDANLFGYIQDVQSITQTFESMNFQVEEEKNKSAQQMIQTVKKWCECHQFTDDKCIVVFLLSHGGEYGVLYGCDGQEIYVDDVISQFCSCEKLKEIPKYFFIQACRGDLSPQPVKNLFQSAGIRFSKKFYNTFIYYSTCEGYASFVSKDGGSIFISEICRVLEENIKSGLYKLWELVTKVNKAVSENVVQHNNQDVAQCPEAVSTLCSDFWFQEVTSTGSKQVKCLELKKRNPCHILTNTRCGTHKNQCNRFKKYKKNAEQTFSALNFQVYEDDDLLGDETSKLFKSVKHSEDLANAECFVCVVLSCGGLNGQKPVIYGADGKFYSVETMVKKVTENEDLYDKPKIFFMVLNKCDKNSFTKAGLGFDEVPERKSQGADTFLYYVIIEDHNSEFISTLSDVLLECRGTHLGDIVLKVNERLHGYGAVEVPEACSTLTSLVYFGSEKTDIKATMPEEIKPAMVISGGSQYSSRLDEDDCDVSDGADIKSTMPKEIKPAMVISGGSQDFADEEDCDGADIVYNYALPEEEKGTGGNEDDFKSILQVHCEDHSAKSRTTCFTTNGKDLENEVRDRSGTIPEPSDSQVNEEIEKIATTSQNRATTTEEEPQVQLQMKKDEEESSATKTRKSVITDITQAFGVMETIAAKLDSITSPNWHDFGMLIVEKYGKELKLKKGDIRNLHLSYYGGGCPAMNFLSRLQAEDPLYNLRSLSSLAKELKRNDISNLVNGWSGSKLLLTELSEEQLKTLSGEMDNGVKGLKNWRHFADRLRYSNSDIKEMELAVKEAATNSNACSPTCRLLGLIEEGSQTFEVSNLCDVASEIRRNDVVEIFKSIMKSHEGRTSVGETDDDETKWNDRT